MDWSNTKDSNTRLEHIVPNDHSKLKLSFHKVLTKIPPVTLDTKGTNNVSIV